MKFEEMVGQEFLFYGQDGYRFKLDDDIWLVVQDDDDAYFPCYKKTVKMNPYYAAVFYREPIAIVCLLRDNKDYSDGYRLQDAEFEHTWLRFGNDNSYPQQPLFYFEYTPMEKRPTQATRQRIYDHNFDSYDHLFNQRES